jgi:hypothetical protein
MGSNLINGKPIFQDIGKAVLAGAIGGALGGAGGLLGNVLAQAGKLGTGLTQLALRTGIDVAFDIAGGVFGTLATGDPITLEGILIGAGIAAGVSLGTAKQALGKLGKFGSSVEGMQTSSFQAGDRFGTAVGDKIKSGFGGGVDAPTVSRPNVDMPGVKPPDNGVKAPDNAVKAPDNGVKPSKTEVKAPETDVKAPETQVKQPETDTPNGRSTHRDKPEVEPGVVAKETAADGHEIKVLKDGRIVRCSDCAEIRKQYKDILDSNDDLRKRLDTIEKEPNEANKAQQAKQFEAELQAIQGGKGKRKLDPDATDGDSSKRSRTDSSPDGSSGKRWDDPTMTEEEFIKGYKERYPYTSLSDNDLKQRYQDGKRLNPETGNLSTPIQPIKPTGTRDNLPTQGEKYEAWQAYRNGDKSKLPCFPAGTLVKTPEGDRAIETLAEGDLVFAYDFNTNSLIESPITAVHKNWTQQIVVIDTPQGRLSSTRSHPYWVESESKWLRAVELQNGMLLRSMIGKLVTVHSVETYAAEEDTYNFEVDRLHNYFVNSSGVLVHNGGDGSSSGFEKTDTFSTDIYEVKDLNTGEVIYVGKSIQGVDTRFEHHLSDPKSAVHDYINNPNSKGYIPDNDPLRKDPNFPKNLMDNIIESRSVRSGEWTRYETAVWEQHYIDQHGGVNGGKLINRINAITPEKFVLYSEMHNPCM